MRKYLWSLVVVLSLLAGFSIPIVTYAEQDPTQRAADILDALSEQYAGYDNIKADFRYLIESRNEDEDFRDEQEGTVWLKDRKFKLELGTQEITSDNETIWTYIKDANEVQVNTFNPDEFEFHPSEIFSVYKDDYRYIYAGHNVEAGKVYDVVELNPLDRDDIVFKVRLYILKSTGQISQTKVFEKNGLVYTYDILNTKTNLKLDDDFFTFREDKHPNVKVVDLR